MSVTRATRGSRPDCEWFAWRPALHLALVLALAAAVVSCSGSHSDGSTPVTPTVGPVATVSLSLSAISLSAGDSTNLSASAKDAQGAAILGRSVTWTTSSVAVASVSTVGLVKAVSAGTATISATIDGKVGTAAVTVVPAVSVATGSVGSSGGVVTLQTGTSAEISAGALRANADVTLKETQATDTSRVDAASRALTIQIGSTITGDTVPVTVRWKLTGTLPANRELFFLARVGAEQNTYVGADSINGTATVSSGKRVEPASHRAAPQTAVTFVVRVAAGTLVRLIPVVVTPQNSTTCADVWRLDATPERPLLASPEATVILVHGWQLWLRCGWTDDFSRNPEFSATQLGDFIYFKPYEDGWKPLAGDILLSDSVLKSRVNVFVYRYPTTLPPSDNAAKLLEMIRADARIPRVKGKVLIVAHSMGGLVARYADQLDSDQRLGGIVTLGTPHLGSPLADRFSPARLVLIPTAGFNSLATNVVNNAVPISSRRVPIHAIRGNLPCTADNVVAVFLPGIVDAARFVLNRECVLAGNLSAAAGISDGIVPNGSAVPAGVSSSYVAAQGNTPLVHTALPGDVNVRANVLAKLREFLGAPAPDPGTGGSEVEPNDRLVTATPLAVGQTLTAAIGTQTDIDIYKLGLAGASNVTFTIGLPAALSGAGRVSAELLDADGTVLATTCTAEGATAAALTVNNVPEHAYIRVGAFASTFPPCYGSSTSSFAVGAYTLRLTATVVGPAGLDAAFEPNERLVDATPLAVGTTLTAALGSTRDVDLYKVSLPSASNVTVTLTLPAELSNSGRLSVNLLDANGNRLAYTCTAERATTATLAMSNVPQFLFAQVTANSYTSVGCFGSSASNFAVGAYDIRVSATPVGPANLDSIFEPNDRLVTATPLAVGQTLTAAIGTQTDIDIYKLGLGGASNVTFTLGLPAALSGAGRVSAELLDADGTVLATTCTAEGATAAALTVNNVPEHAYIRVGAFASTFPPCYGSSTSSFAVGAYTLRLTATVVGPAGLDAAFEPNERLVDATPLAVGTTLTAALGSTRDVDLYKVSLPSASNVTVTLTLPAELSNSGRLSVNLLDANGNRLAYTCTAERATEATLTMDALPQVFFLQMTANAYTGATCFGSSASNFAVGAYAVRVTLR